MAVANIIARGIGFSPGSVKFIVTHGFSIASGLHHAESIMQAIVAAATDLATTGARVYRGRAYAVPAADSNAIRIWQGDDDSITQFVGDGVVSLLSVSLEAVASEATAQIDTTLNAIREEVTVALMADYTLGLAYVESVLEVGADEPEISGDGDSPRASMKMDWQVIYHHSRANPTN